jgi:hypothetical protein
MKCPHCLIAFHSEGTLKALEQDDDLLWRAHHEICPNCKKIIITILGLHIRSGSLMKKFLVYPKAISRAPISSDVVDKFASDYKEACLVLVDSPKASAALSRRCLQNILREKAGVKKSDLNNEIEQIIQSKQLPSYLAESIDAVRNIGNFATHPIKSTNSGEIVDVEPGEAEWLLDVLEGLFDFYFVQPAELKRKRDALNKKLTDAGKPPMK